MMKIKNASSKLKKKYEAAPTTEDALYFLKKGAQKGYPWALGQLGFAYCQGTDIEKDIKKGRSLLELAAEKGSLSALVGLAHLYTVGDGVARDEKKASELFLKAAEKGHFASMLGIAEALHCGRGLAQDFEAALGWYEKAIKKADELHPLSNAEQKIFEECKLSIAKAYFFGIGTQKNSLKALKIFEEFEDHNEETSLMCIGFAYQLGEAVEQNYNKAFEYIKRAADLGNNIAQYWIGTQYMKPDSKLVKKDEMKAKKWLELAANQNNEDAQFLLGSLFALSDEWGKAAHWLEISANRGYSKAGFLVASMYIFGHEVDVDEQKAISFAKFAAEQGELNAQSLLGWAYSQGVGVEGNSEKAHFWWDLAAKQGDADAQANLGMAYLEGWGCDKDIDVAIDWLEQAAAQGMENAQELLADLQTNTSTILEFPSKDIKIQKDRWLKNMLASFADADKDLQIAFLSQISGGQHLFDYSIQDLIKTDENQEIEFKETFSIPTRASEDGTNIKVDVIRYAALKEIAGFLNSNDGSLLIGVADGKNTDTKEPEIRGIEHDNFSGDKDKYALTIMNLVKAAFGQTAASLLNISFEEIGSKTVCRIDCKKSSEPVYCSFKNYGDKPFVRYGSSTVEPVQKEWLKWVNAKF